MKDYVSQRVARLTAALGEDDETGIRNLTLSDVGCRTLGRSICIASAKRGGIDVYYDRGRVGKVIPIPKSREETLAMLTEDAVENERALMTSVRMSLLKGEIIGICSGRPNVRTAPMAYLVPYPHTAVLAEMMTDRVWGIVEGK